MSQPRQGLVHVYTGPGKGKTTAALGQTWRALGAGLRVCFLQFLKGGITPSEQRLAEHFGSDLVFRNFAHPLTAGLRSGTPGEEDAKYVKLAWQAAREALANPDYDLVVLDEVNNTIHLGLLAVEDLLKALRHRPPPQYVICTGRHAPQALIDFADLVTEMRLVKHPYKQGAPAHKGIEI